jgi:cytochrome c oxidase subunit 4
MYTANLFALMFLTVITVAAASFNFGSANVVIALAIASVKAILVGLIFMHLLWDKPVNAIILVAAFLFLGIFLMFDFLDVTSRNTYPPRNMTPMENATPVPDSMNPLKAAPPKPLQPAKAAEEKSAEEHK